MYSFRISVKGNPKPFGFMIIAYRRKKSPKHHEFYRLRMLIQFVIPDVFLASSFTDARLRIDQIGTYSLFFKEYR